MQYLDYKEVKCNIAETKLKSLPCFPLKLQAVCYGGEYVEKKCCTDNITNNI